MISMGAEVKFKSSLNNNSVDQLAKKEMVTGMNYTTRQHAQDKCEGCVLGKSHRNPCISKAK